MENFVLVLFYKQKNIVLAENSTHPRKEKQNISKKQRYSHTGADWLEAENIREKNRGKFLSP